MLIKGSGLTQSEVRTVREAGRELLHRMLVEYPDEPVDAIRAQHSLGVAYLRDKLYSQASKHFEAALHLEEEGVRVTTWSDLELAETIVAADWSHRFDEALRWLDHYWNAGSPFPATNFRALLTEARLSARTGRSRRARELAERALELLANNKSPFPHHRGIGLIKTDKMTFRELERLAR